MLCGVLNSLVISSHLPLPLAGAADPLGGKHQRCRGAVVADAGDLQPAAVHLEHRLGQGQPQADALEVRRQGVVDAAERLEGLDDRSEEHTSELQSLLRISYAVICLKKKKTRHKPESNRKTLK